MANHWLIVVSGPMKGAQYAITEAGLNIDIDGVTDGEPLLRFEIRGAEAALMHFKEGKCDATVRVEDGHSFSCNNVMYLYQRRDCPVDPVCFDRAPSKVISEPWEESVSVGCPSELVELKLQFLLGSIRVVMRKARRAAVLLDAEGPDGFLAGVYSSGPFPVDRSVIEAVAGAGDPKFMSADGTVCCVALPEPNPSPINKSFIYIQAHAADPFDLVDFEGLTQMASVGCVILDVVCASKLGRDRDKRSHLIMADIQANLPGTIVRISEPGTTLGPGAEGVVPVSQRRFVALGTEILRLAVITVPAVRRAAVFFKEKSPYGPVPEFWFPHVFDMSPWIVGTALTAQSRTCTNVYGDICCVALQPDEVAAGVLYIESWKDATEDPDQLAALIKVAQSASSIVRDIIDPCEIIGRSPAIERVREFVREQAQRDTPVLIEGEMGTGKHLIARAIHQASARRNRPFIWEFCKGPGAVPGTLDGLYGYGPSAGRGRLDRAGGGTLFLKEIEDLDLATQAELLRFMREGTFTRIGDTVLRRANLRILATATQNLEDAVSDGRFLEDLYLQLMAGRIVLPRLSEHREDIPLLVSEFMQQDSVRHYVKGIAPEAVELIKKRRWKYNVLELRAALTSAACAARSELIEAADLPETARLK